MSWKKSMDLKQQKQAMNCHDYELYCLMREKWTHNHKMTLVGVRAATAKYFSWLMGETWAWGKGARKGQLEIMLACCMKADLGWWHNGFFRLTTIGQDLLLRYLNTHPTGKRVATKWATLMATALIQQGLPTSLHPSEWPPHAEDQLRDLCRDLEEGFELQLEALLC
jgi:hypothetical protein